ncbi:hypothetical protein [Streptomyces sp. NPDC020742]
MRAFAWLHEQEHLDADRMVALSRPAERLGTDLYRTTELTSASQGSSP